MFFLSGSSCLMPEIASKIPRMRLARSFRRWLAGGVVCSLASLMLAPQALAAKVENLRLWTAPDHTRLVFDLDSAAKAKVFGLDNPRRLVIDLAGSEVASAAVERKFAALNLEGSAIKSIRSGRQGDALRVVLDLTRPVNPKDFTLAPNAKYGNRLVVDLEFPGESAVENPIDPIEARIREQEQAAAKRKLKGEPAEPVVNTQAAAHPKRDIIIAIDPGHGGEDPGASGPSGTREKDVVLKIGKRLKRMFDAQPGFKAILTRNSDYYIPLRKRTEIAREQKADFFVSIHADAFNSPRPHGSSVFALSSRGATSETARWLAATENRADLIGGVDGNLSLNDKDEMLRGVLLDLTMTATLNDSLAAGSGVLANLGRMNSLHKRQVEQAGFVVLKSPDIPSLLVETGFISNPQEERNLNSGPYQEKLARSIFSGIQSHFERNPPPASLLAWQRSQARGGNGGEYRVKSGDTLSEVAQRHNVSMAALKQANNMSGDTVRVGQLLKIPRS